jgi:hypothetical protein
VSSLKIEEMKNLILLLKKFKDELDNSEYKRDVNKVMKIIDKTVEEKRYYSY